MLMGGTRFQISMPYVVAIFFFNALTAFVLYLALFTKYKPTDSFIEFRFITLILFAPLLIKYAIHVLLAPWHPFIESRRDRKHRHITTPSVSVLIPAKNEEVGIITTITSVLQTRYPKLEIVVINDGSTDRTHEVVNRFIRNYKTKNGAGSSRVLYKSVKNRGKAGALNAGLAVASGEIIITIDADSVMDGRAIEKIVKHFSNPRVASVAGNVVIGNRTRPLGFIQQLEYVYGFYLKRTDDLLNAVYIVGGAAAAYRASVIKKLGGFDETIITEDIEISTRLQDHGYLVRYAPDAIVYTEGPSDFQGLARQRLRWKYGRLLTFYKYRHLFFSLQQRHNRYLSFIVLPIALFAEILLFLEVFLLLIFIICTVYTNDFVPLAFVIVFLGVVITLQIITDPIAKYHKNLLLLAPAAWIVFYIIDYVEYRALISSIRLILKKQKLTWQSWTRCGVFGKSAS